MLRMRGDGKFHPILDASLKALFSLSLWSSGCLAQCVACEKVTSDLWPLTHAGRGRGAPRPLLCLLPELPSAWEACISHSSCVHRGKWTLPSKKTSILGTFRLYLCFPVTPCNSTCFPGWVFPQLCLGCCLARGDRCEEDKCLLSPGVGRHPAPAPATTGASAFQAHVGSHFRCRCSCRGPLPSSESEPSPQWWALYLPPTGTEFWTQAEESQNSALLPFQCGRRVLATVKNIWKSGCDEGRKMAIF